MVYEKFQTGSQRRLVGDLPLLPHQQLQHVVQVEDLLKSILYAIMGNQIIFGRSYQVCLFHRLALVRQRLPLRVEPEEEVPLVAEVDDWRHVRGQRPLQRRGQRVEHGRTPPHLTGQLLSPHWGVFLLLTSLVLEVNAGLLV